MTVLLAFLLPAHAGGADLGGYFRVMTRPDLVGGDGKLGYWNLYGRLLNEGPYGALELKLDILDRQPGSDDVWTDLHVKVEGGSIGNADAGNGSLANMRLSQMYVQTGNLLLPGVTWRLGTLESNFGDLGLYDMRLAQVLFDTLGASARYQNDRVDLTIGAGDAGYSIRGSRYNTILTSGATVRLRLSDHAEIGGGGQGYFEPKVVGNRFAPYATPELTYDQYLRGDFVSHYVEDNPGEATIVPSPEARKARSGKIVGYLGFGDLGPLRWNSLYGNVTKLHPEGFYTETYNDEEIDLYVTDLTDERRQVAIGDEMQIRIVPEHLDAVAAALYGKNTDGDNNLAPSDLDRTFWSTVLRLQLYATPSTHLLLEGSYAQELSHNGNAFRNHKNSVFQNSQDPEDPLAFQTGDSDERTTIQGKGGIVLNPLGTGIYTRPSLRLLYGVQWSSQNNAFGNSYVETVDQYNYFGNVERHVHQVVALETEVWF